MIEIIKNNARKEFECPECKSIIAYDPIDVKECGEYFKWYSYVKCPICDEDYVIEKIDALEGKKIVINDYGGYEIIYRCPKCSKIYFNKKTGVSYLFNKSPFTCECGKKLYIGDGEVNFE